MQTDALLAQQDQDGAEPVVDGITRSSVDGLVDFLPIPEGWEWLAEYLISPGLTIVVVLLLALVISRIAKRLIKRAVKKMDSPNSKATRRAVARGTTPEVEDLRRQQRAQALGNVAKSLVGVVVWVVAFIMVLGQIGIHLGPLIAGAGIAGVALGFGAQDLVKDFLSGMFMLIEDQYGIGDVIDAGEAVGVVEGITLRSTRLRDLEGTLWHVPNGEIRRVGNMSQEYSHGMLDVRIAYDTDIDTASELMESVASAMSTEPEWDRIMLEAPEMMGVENLGADAIDIRMRIKTLPGKQWTVSRELRRRIKNAFDAAHIQLPVQQRTVWLRTEQALAIGDHTTQGYESAPVPSDHTDAIEASKQAGAAAADPGGAEPSLADLPDPGAGGEH